MLNDESLDFATEILLSPANLKPGQLEAILGNVMTRKVDEADIYLQGSRGESWLLEDGIVKTGDFSIDRGFGFRVISGEKTGFAYADEIALPALEKAAQSARSIVRSGGSGLVQVSKFTSAPHLYPPINPLDSFSEKDKIALLHEIDSKARAMDPRIQQVMVSLSASYNIILLINSEGAMAADVRPLVSLWVKVIAEQNQRREKGQGGGGGRTGYEIFTTQKLGIQFAEKAVHQALLNLSAADAPAGAMPVVLGPGWPAVLLHEAVGHGLEADFNRKGSSVFTGRLGQKVISSLCTIVDDGTIPGRRGSITIDDEGTPSQNTILIEQGVLKNYIQDKHNARLMGMSLTGNGRRESYAHLPIPRMTNTYMLPGQSHPEEIIASVRKGLYAVDFAGGQVDTATGKFVFTTSEAYLIENGKITTPVKGATLIGDGLAVLNQVSMVGNDLQLDPGIGACGKDGQTIPVGVGQPTLKVDLLTVGGSSA
ncbi:MAG: metalloprotease TldD [Proteobacteria bacterium]|nr:metalloprotease TldD [Pseudomonadota bacterium]